MKLFSLEYKLEAVSFIPLYDNYVRAVTHGVTLHSDIEIHVFGSGEKDVDNLV